MPRGVSRYDEARFQRRLWTPANDPAGYVTRWFDASDLTTITANGSNQVSAWKDKSKNKDTATQATTANMPILAFDGVFGPMPSLKFTSASAQNLNFGPLGTGNMSYVALVERNTFTTNHRTILSGQSATSPQMRIDTTHQIELLSAGVASIMTATKVIAQGPAILSAQLGTSNQIRTNGTLETGGSSTTFSNGVGRIGGNYGTGEDFDGRIAEIVVYSGFLPTRKVQQIEGYLAWKWGQQELLLAGHPYAQRPPLIGVG